MQWTQHMEVRDLRGQRSRWAGPVVKGGRGEDRLGDKDNLFWGSNLSDQVRAKGEDEGA